MSTSIPNTWAPVGNRRIPRRILQVPKAQQPLLDRDDIWHPARYAVPDDVIASAKEAYLDSMAPRPKLKEKSQPRTSLPPPTSSPAAPPDSDDDESREEREVSWPPTPSRRPEAEQLEDA